MRRVIGLTVLATFILAAAVIAGAFTYRAWRQHQSALALAITSANGIDEGLYVKLQGIDEWITIRGEDRNNPVLLMVAGGPGESLVPLSILFRSWEKYFTIVQWDQPGVGRTFQKNGERGEGTMSAPRFAADGVALTAFLRARLNKQKIIVLGDSFGTNVGLRMIRLKPQYFYAYVGTGQVVTSEGQEEYDYDVLSKQVSAANDTNSERLLKGIGRPPYRSMADLQIERRVASEYAPVEERDMGARLRPIFLFARDTTLVDICTARQHGDFAVRSMIDELISYDARTFGTEYGVPIFVFEGARDSISPIALSQPWLNSLHAPMKEFVVFAEAGHSLLLSQPDAFLKELVHRVRPIAIRPGRTAVLAE
jgi:pimeloyl-ACP methyl ester carboxylesterase